MNQNYRLILASGSPRRKKLLEQAGYQFDVMPPPDSVECDICSERSPVDLVTESSFLKARHCASRVAEGIVLAADTVAECQGQILGKPRNQADAEQMLRLMSGRRHRVLTGVTLWKRPTDKYQTQVVQTVLRMDPLSETQLQQYLESDQWVGKAGAFGYQDGLDWVHIVYGSASNVVGLPMEALEAWLQQLA